MSTRINLVTALALSVATFAQAHAGQATEATSRFYLAPVVGAAFSDERIATNPVEVRHQGGFATAGTVRWLAAAPVSEAKVNEAARFYLPDVVGFAFSDKRIATNVVEVRGQGGFATAGTVQWLATAPVAEAQVNEAARFYLPGVVGLAFSDKRVATNPVEVRSQGGFAVAGTVRWLPSAPVDNSTVARTAQAPVEGAHPVAID